MPPARAIAAARPMLIQPPGRLTPTPLSGVCVAVGSGPGAADVAGAEGRGVGVPVAGVVVGAGGVITPSGSAADGATLGAAEGGGVDGGGLGVAGVGQAPLGPPGVVGGGGGVTTRWPVACGRGPRS